METKSESMRKRLRRIMKDGTRGVLPEILRVVDLDIWDPEIFRLIVQIALEVEEIDPKEIADQPRLLSVPTAVQGWARGGRGPVTGEYRRELMDFIHRKLSDGAPLS